MCKRNHILVAVAIMAVLALMGCGSDKPSGPGGDTVAPAPVVGLKGWVTRGVPSIAVSWKQSPELDLASYRVYRSVNGGTSALVATGTTAGFVDGSVTGDKTYVYQVSAVDQSDNESQKASTPIIEVRLPSRGSQAQID